MPKSKKQSDPLAHYKSCDCVYCSRPWLKEFITEDLIGPSILDEHLKYLRGLDVSGVEKKKNHWASGSLYPCLRKEWLRYHEAEPTNMDWNIDVLALGKSIEEDLIEKYKLSGSFVKEGKYIEIEDPRLKMPITGKVDLLIVEDGIVIPVEIKSRKDYGEFRHYDAWRKLLPMVEHMAQLTIYLKGTGLQKGYIEYVNKNRSIRARYGVRFPQRFYDEIIERFVQLEESLTKTEPPIPKGFKSDVFPCAWYSQDRNKEEPVGKCAFFEHCYGEVPIVLKIEQLTW